MDPWSLNEWLLTLRLPVSTSRDTRSARPRSCIQLKNAVPVTGPGAASLWSPALGRSNSRQFSSIIVENDSILVIKKK
jgi:hypothetical protein